jgi:hypothetical protein
MTLEQLIADINAADLRVHNLSQGPDRRWYALVWAFKNHHHDWGSGVTPIDALQRAFDVVKSQLSPKQPEPVEDGSDLC